MLLLFIKGVKTFGYVCKCTPDEVVVIVVPFIVCFPA